MPKKSPARLRISNCRQLLVITLKQSNYWRQWSLFFRYCSLFFPYWLNEASFAQGAHWDKKYTLFALEIPFADHHYISFLEFECMLSLYWKNLVIISQFATNDHFIVKTLCFYKLKGTLVLNNMKRENFLINQMACQLWRYSANKIQIMNQSLYIAHVRE